MAALLSAAAAAANATTNVTVAVRLRHDDSAANGDGDDDAAGPVWRVRKQGALAYSGPRLTLEDKETPIKRFRCVLSCVGVKGPGDRSQPTNVHQPHHAAWLSPLSLPAWTTLLMQMQTTSRSSKLCCSQSLTSAAQAIMVRVHSHAPQHDPPRAQRDK